MELYQESLELFKYSSDKLLLIEIGVRGNSSLGWTNWFSDVESFSYIGIAIDPPGTIRLEAGEAASINVEVVPQVNEELLRDVCAKYGPIDIIIDNGMTGDADIMLMTLKTLFPCMSEKGLYFIDTSTPTSNSSNHSSMVSTQLLAKQSAEVFRLMHYWWSKDESFTDPIFSKQVKRIELMQDLIVFEKAATTPYREVFRGSERIPNLSMVGLQFTLGNNQILNINVDISEHSSTIPHERIKAQCLEICSEYPSMRLGGTSVEECARRLKQEVISSGFWSKDEFLFGGDPPSKA